MPDQLFIFPNVARRDPEVERWFAARAGRLGDIALEWFQVFRDRGDDVRELLHDHHPTACVGEAAFGYVNVFTSHVNVGFFRGSKLDDPSGMLEGTGKLMRHVKLRPERSIDSDALRRLLELAYRDMRRRVGDAE